MRTLGLASQLLAASLLFNQSPLRYAPRQKSNSFTQPQALSIPPPPGLPNERFRFHLLPVALR